ncbi:MAG TPA: NAD(P)H-dependent oxidoreductase [Catalimonadaceae bacterium]|nr:NAD(P)H-dependent oxidoreductase [Catalimonadaceae bacterium]HPI10284.1 NAD(P)H-dependent oxidoreductase [Catalimonadaceae bacterium]
MNILIVSASPRQNSLTFRFCQYFLKILRARPETNHVTVVDFDAFDIPTIGKGSFKRNALSPFQEKLISEWEKADLIFLCSPEYNWTANAELLILFDRICGSDFRHLFHDKVIASVGVSSGRGGRQPALDINKVLSKVISFLDEFSIISPKILEVHEASKNLNEEAEFIGHPAFEAAVRNFVDYSLLLNQRWIQGRI